MTMDRTSETARAYNELDDEQNHNSFGENFQVSEVKEDQHQIAAMETIVAAIKEIHRDILTTIQTDEATQSKLERLMADMQAAAFNLRERLRNMEKNIEREEEKYKARNTVPLMNKSEPESLIVMRIQHSALKHKLSTIMQEYNKIQLEYRNQCRERIRRQLHVIGRDVTDHELEELLEQPLDFVFVDSLREEQEQLALNDVEARHRDLINVEQSIREMQGLFLNLSIIVETQQDMVDHIEYNVSTTENYVGRAKVEIAEAEQNRIKSRKRTMYLLFGLAVVMTVVILIIIA